MLLLLLTLIGFHQILGTTLPGAYANPPTPVHDVYSVDVVGCGGEQTVLVAVEVPWSTHSTEVRGWYKVPLTIHYNNMCLRPSGP